MGRDTLWTELVARAEADAEATLIATPDGPLTCGGLAASAERLAGGLAAMGAGPGTRVAVFADNRAEHFSLAFAANRIGTSYAPVNPLYRGVLVENVLNTLDPQLVVVDSACRPALEPFLDRVKHWVVMDDDAAGGLPGEVVSYAELAASAPPSTPAPLEHKEAMVLFTSGTTGPSKGISMPDTFLLEVARTNAMAREVTPEDRLYSCFAFCHANPIGYTLLPALVSGASAAWSPSFSASKFWQTLTELQATQFTAFSAVFMMLLGQEPSDADRSHPARVCMGIGTPRKGGAEFEERFGVRIVEPYGLSECGAVSYQWREARRLASIGKPTPGWQVQVVDDEDNPLAPDEVGEIVARPLRPGLLMDGYIGRPEATLEAYRNLWFHSGDRGYFDADGFLWFVDRKKDAIRRRGENISSFEVEEAVVNTGLVEECAAYPVPSEMGEDEVMIAVVAPEEAFDAEALLTALQEQLPSYAMPAYVRVVGTLPRTPTGKVEKYKLREHGVTPDTWQRPKPAGRR